MELCRLCTKKDENLFDCRILSYIEEGKSAVVKKLLESCACNKFCDLADSSGSTLLHYAAKYSNLKLLDFLINSGSNVNAKDGNGDTPLILAIQAGQQKVIVKLLEAKARIDIKNNFGEDALYTIARLRTRFDRDKRFQIVKRFVLQLKLECSKDSQSMANRLLESECPLCFAVFLKNAMVTDIMLISRKIDPHELATAICVAVAIADLANVKLLVDNSAIDACDEEQPLLYYKYLTKDTPQKLEILKIVLAHTNFDDEKLHEKIYSLLSECSCEVVRILLEHVDLSTKEMLHGLMLNANEGITNELPADGNLDFDTIDSDGNSCLVYAVCANNNFSTVEFLLRKGVQVNRVNRLGLSVLFNAIHNLPSSRTLKIMNILLKYGADVQCTYKSDITLFDYADQQIISLIKPVIAQLAILESLGKPISQLIYDKIESRDMFKSHFKLCKTRLERMKRITVHKSVTLYKLLTESDKKVMSYVQNPEFPDRFNRLMRGRRRSNAYYDFLLRRRTFECIHAAQLKRDAAVALSEILQVDNHTVTDHVLGYLSADDWKSLRDVH